MPSGFLARRPAVEAGVAQRPVVVRIGGRLAQHLHFVQRYPVPELGLPRTRPGNLAYPVPTGYRVPARGLAPPSPFGRTILHAAMKVRASPQSLSHHRQHCPAHLSDAAVRRFHSSLSDRADHGGQFDRLPGAVSAMTRVVVPTAHWMILTRGHPQRSITLAVEPEAVWLDSALPGEARSFVDVKPHVVVIGVAGADASAQPVILIQDRLDIGREGAGIQGEWLIEDDPEVSSWHVSITAGQTFFEIEDPASRNGTFIDGLQVRGRHPARDGSLVFIGRRALVLRFLSEEARAAIDEDERDPIAVAPTTSGRLALLHRSLRKRARSHEPLWLSGAPGVGQAHYLREIHRRSGRTGVMIEISGHDLAAAEGQRRFFGFANRLWKGAEPGLLDTGPGNTLCIHDAEKVPGQIQQALATFLADGYYRPINGHRRRRSTARLIVLTRQMPIPGQHLPALLPEFQDRIGPPLRIPSLAHRKEDLAALALRHLGPAWRISRDVLRALCLHCWPGNQTELEAVCSALASSAASSGEDREIRFQHLPTELSIRPLTRERYPRGHAHGRGSTETLPSEPDPDAPEVSAEQLCAEFAESLGEEHGLSPQMARILRLSFNGLSNKEIAGEIGIDVRTVGTHWDRIYQRTGSRDAHDFRRYLIRFALLTGRRMRP